MDRNNNAKFIALREQYPVFLYEGWTLTKLNGALRVKFRFSVPGLCDFRPETTLITDSLKILNDAESLTAQKILFSLGLVEAVSYWKCVCSPRFAVRCGSLDEDDKRWWKKLWYNGLGEFFYRNGIQTDEDSFVTMDAKEVPERTVDAQFISGGLNLIPIGGGKDSAVTLDLLGDRREQNLCFTVNDQPARTQTIRVAGYGDERVVRTYRTIDPQLLKRNAEGFLNGHTPFSAVVAFLGYYVAYLTGAEHIVLSNETSANDVSVDATRVNHQYSKSYEFECDFNIYAKKHFGAEIRYFSLLRGFNELQIAKRFAALPVYHGIFRSCNAGSKTNEWCCACAKCLFVYTLLSPFLDPEAVVRIFGENLFEKMTMLDDMKKLSGFSKEKPFECVGTADEVLCALAMTAKRYEAAVKPLPALLQEMAASGKLPRQGCHELLTAFDPRNGVPPAFENLVTEMYKYVSNAD